MSFVRFIKYEKSYIIMFLLVFVLSISIMIIESDSAPDWTTVVYAFLLCTIMMIVFLVYRYQKSVKAVNNVRKEQHEVMSMEAEHYMGMMEDMRRNHIREMNHVHNQQKAHYDFIVSWFHEIKTPISVLNLMKEADHSIKDIDSELSKIEHYADQALYYAKVDDFHQDYSISSCDVIGIVKNVIKSHSEVFISKKIILDIKVKQMNVQSDSKWLKFIINQVITNSLKYTPENGRITIEASETFEEKELKIRDNGIGISRNNIHQVFNRGFTGEIGRTHAASTGMGLYLAQELSKKLGHYMSCESEKGEYTEFCIHFPMDQDPYHQMNKMNGRVFK